MKDKNEGRGKYPLPRCSRRSKSSVGLVWSSSVVSVNVSVSVSSSFACSSLQGVKGLRGRMFNGHWAVGNGEEGAIYLGRERLLALMSLAIRLALTSHWSFRLRTSDRTRETCKREGGGEAHGERNGGED